MVAITKDDVDYALMAGAAYCSTRDAINLFPVPDGWNIVSQSGGVLAEGSGFEASVFGNGADIASSTDIVISFAGTVELVDWISNVKLGLGFNAEQLKQAARYYLYVKELNPTATISFTGHSLGGGLAALMGVFFDKKAVTFDQAPFAQSATESVRDDLKAYLLNLKGADQQPLYSTDVLAWLAPELSSFSDSDLAIRTANVSGLYVEGEVLSKLFSNMIGVQTPLPQTSTGLDAFGISLHAQSLLTAFLQSDQSAPAANGDNPKQTLSEVTKKLTGLLGMIFDENLYYHDWNDKENPERNFLEYLVQHQEGPDPNDLDGDNMIGRFTADMWKIAQDGGLTMNSNLDKAPNAITNTLIAFAMQAYYDERLARGETLFESVEGGIRFNRYNVSNTLAGEEDGAIGYKGTDLDKMFTSYLQNLWGDQKAALMEKLPDLLDWYIQAGRQAMVATAGNERAFMLGGSGDDFLTGGSQADVLVGNMGQDTLYGGAGDDVLLTGWGRDGFSDNTGDTLYGEAGNDKLYGGFGADILNGGADKDILYGGGGADTLKGEANADLMIGGEGIDTYYIEGVDTIVDSGSNFIVYDGQILAGGFVQVEGTTNVYRSISNDQFTFTFNSPGHLVLNGTDSVTFENQTCAADFENGDFGIRLYDSVEADRTLTGAEERDWVTVMQPSSNIIIFGFWGGGGEISGENIYNNLGYFGFFLPSTPGDTKIYGQGGNDLLYGLSGSDYIDGGDSDDVIRGEMIYNNLYGEMGNGDILLGGNGKDVIVGSSGKDLVSGGEDNDFLDGYAANDTITGDGGDDVLAGGAGDDQLLGGTGNDYLCGDAFLSVYGATHSILMNSTAYEYWDADVSTMGFNVTYDDSGYAISVALQGFDLPVYGTGADQLFGGIGNDILIGAGGNDILMGEADHDRLEGGEGDDYLDGGDGNDLLLGSGGADTLLGGIGDDLLHGDSSDTPLLLQGDDYLSGGEGDDDLLGYGGNDVLEGGAGFDYLEGGAGDDTYIFKRGDGQEIINDSNGDEDTLRFVDALASEVRVTRGQFNLYLALGSTGDTLTLENWFLDNSYKIERLEFADGTTWDVAKLESMITVAPSSDAGDTLYASDNGEIISGFGGDDDLVGGKGNDTLYGGPGVDLLMGNAGDDTLVGGDGNDFYMLNRGFGHDTVIEAVADGDVDRIIFGGDIAPADVYVYHDERNLYFSVMGTNDLLTLYGWFTLGNLGSDDWAQYSQFMAVEGVRFADGTIWDANYLKAIAANAPYTNALTLYGGVGVDLLRGYIGDDRLHGGAGDDYIDGGAGDDMLYGEGDNDTILGGIGHDWLYGNDGDDILYGEDGDDVLIAGPGNDILYGGDGIDYLTADSGNNILDGGDGRDDLMGGTGDDILLGGAENDYIFGYLGNNTLDGGSGDDRLLGYDGNDIVIGGVGQDGLYGGAGDDVYVFGRGFGQDEIQEPNYSTWVNSDIGNEDIIRFIDGIAPADVLVSRGVPGYRGEGADIAAKKLCFSIKDTNDRVYVYGWFSNDYYKIEKVEFADGTSWDVAQILAAVAPVIIEGNDQDNRYRGLLDGDITSDWIYGYGGNDSLSGRAGNDILDGGDGDDAIYGDSGDDALYGGAGDDNLDGGTGNDILVGGAGLDDLYGGDGDDILDGGAGNDFLEDDNGDDIFIFGRGYGQDIVYSWDENLSFTDIVRFKADVAPTDVVVSRAADGSYDLVLSIKGTDDALTISGFFDPDYGQNMQIDGVEFSDGTVWDVEHLTALASGAVDDVFITGTAGADTLTGTTGNDTLQGGAGNDMLTGGDGNDIYIFNPGDGVDRITDSGGTDTIRFGEGITSDSLSLGLGSLLVRVGNQGDAIHLEGFNPADPFNSSVIENFEFTGGTVLGIGDLLARGLDIQGSTGDDLLTGTVITDRITGGEGNDTLAGGKGDDLLAGGGGNDTYVFNLGDGVDTIEDVSSAVAGNLIVFGAGIALVDLAFERDGNDLLIHVGSQGDIVRLRDFDRFGNNGSLVADTLHFVDGSQASLFALTNTPPELGVMAENQTAFEDAAYIFTIPADTFVDADDGDTLTYSATLGNGNVLPPWLAFDPATRTFSGTPANDDVGTLNVTVTATDRTGAGVSDTFTLDVANTNDAPEAIADAGFVGEDQALLCSGNVLANDNDVDAGTTLSVAAPGEYAGNYGSLSLASDGSYVYALDNMSNAVQSLGREAVVAEHFSYTATDGIVSVASALDITLTGSNDAPILAAPLADRQVNFHKEFSWNLQAGSFVDPDQGDTLDYSATLADGSPLPAWLSFDAATQTFSGQAPKQVCSVDVKVTATDKVATTGSTEGSLSTSDVFRITVSHGNEGVGNGEDAPPTGHDDGNFNDGPGTGPGNPGRRGDYDDYRSRDRGEERSDDLDNDRAWGQPQQEQPAYLNASHWDDVRVPETAESVEQADPTVMFGRWLTMDLAVSKALAEKKTLSWLDERMGADTTALSKASSGFLGSTTPFGSDLFSLQSGQGQGLKGFKGLSEGFRKVA